MLEGEDNVDAEDCVKAISSSEDERLFELACTELANKNVRRILKEIASGKATAVEISSGTELSVQDVLIHLNRLESMGLIERDTTPSSSLRGRASRHYRISKLAVVLIPTEIVDKVRLRQFLSKKAYDLMKRRLLISALFACSWAIAFWTTITFSNVAHLETGPIRSSAVELETIIAGALSSLIVFFATWCFTRSKVRAS